MELCLAVACLHQFLIHAKVHEEPTGASMTKEQPVSSYMEHASCAPTLTTSNYKSDCSCNSILYHKIIKYKEYKTNDSAIRRERRGH